MNLLTNHTKNGQKVRKNKKMSRGNCANSWKCITFARYNIIYREYLEQLMYKIKTKTMS